MRSLRVPKVVCVELTGPLQHRVNPKATLLSSLGHRHRETFDDSLPDFLLGIMSCGLDKHKMTMWRARKHTRSLNIYKLG